MQKPKEKHLRNGRQRSICETTFSLILWNTTINKTNKTLALEEIEQFIKLFKSKWAKQFLLHAILEIKSFVG